VVRLVHSINVAGLLKLVDEEAKPMANDDDEGPDHHGTYLHFQEHGML